MSLQVPYNCGIHSYFGMQTSHVTFSHSVLKLRVVFFTSYLGFKVKFSIKILPVICRPKQRFLFFLMAAFFWGGEAMKNPLRSWKFLGLEFSFSISFPKGAPRFCLYDPLFRSEVIGTTHGCEDEILLRFHEGNSPTAKEVWNFEHRWSKWCSMKKTCKNASAPVQVDMPKMSP